MKDTMAYMRSGCKCNCCMWHRSPTVKIILAVMFLAIVVDLAAQLVFGANIALQAALAGFVGVILLIVGIGWLVSMACSCKGRHWIHGAEDDPLTLAQKRYAGGAITKKQYQEIAKELSK